MYSVQLNGLLEMTSWTQDLHGSFGPPLLLVQGCLCFEADRSREANSFRGEVNRSMTYHSSRKWTVTLSGLNLSLYRDRL